MHDREIIGGVAEGMIMKVSDTLEHSIPSLQAWSVNSSSNTILELTYTRITHRFNMLPQNTSYTFIFINVEKQCQYPQTFLRLLMNYVNVYVGLQQQVRFFCTRRPQQNFAFPHILPLKQIFIYFS